MVAATKRPARGFTYLGLVILLAILGLVGAAGLKMGTLFERAAAEEELLEIGAQFSEALRSYAAATPEGQPKQPPSLQELLKDTRFPTPRRHLRKIFVDPITGKPEWGIVYLGDKVGVLGVYSLSNRRPLKVANFDIRFQNLEGKERISDWKFMIAGGDGMPGNVRTPPNSPTAPSLFPDGAPPPPDADGAARDEPETDSVSSQEREAMVTAEAERQAAEDAARLAEEAAQAEAASSSPEQTAPPPGRKY